MNEAKKLSKGKSLRKNSMKFQQSPYKQTSIPIPNTIQLNNRQRNYYINDKDRQKQSQQRKQLRKSQQSQRFNKKMKKQNWKNQRNKNKGSQSIINQYKIFNRQRPLKVDLSAQIEQSIDNNKINANMVINSQRKNKDYTNRQSSQKQIYKKSVRKRSNSKVTKTKNSIKNKIQRNHNYSQKQSQKESVDQQIYKKDILSMQLIQQILKDAIHANQMKVAQQYRKNKYEKDGFMIMHKKKQQNLDQWLGKVYEDCISTGLNHFIKGNLSQKQAKAFCCEQILSNLLQKLEQFKNNESEKCLFSEINKISLKILEHLCNKYPQTDINGVNKRLKKKVSRNIINQWEDDHYDFIFRSGVQFQFQQFVNYSKPIMQFLNYLITLPYSKHQKSFKEKQTTNFKFFQYVMTTIFKTVSINRYEKQEQVIRQDVQLVMQKASTYFDRKKSTNLMKQDTFLESDTDFAEIYSPTMKFAISAKIAQNTPTYTPQQVQSGIIDIQSPAISRILDKWSEQLNKKIINSKQEILNRVYRFKSNRVSPDISDQQFYKLPLQQVRNLHDKLQTQSKTLIKFYQQIKHNVYDLSDKLSQNQVSDVKDLTYMKENQRRMGQFSIKMNKASSTYYIQSINTQIHILLDVIRKLKKQWIQKHKFNESPIYETLDISLVTFKLGDMMRCKVSSKEQDIMRILNIFLKLNQDKQNQLIKIIRIKDRLSTGNQDILINFMFDQICPCQIQLLVSQDQDKKQKYFDKFNHFLYQLKRAQLGPIMQMCIIWASIDTKSLTFTKHINRSIKQRINSIKQTNSNRLTVKCMKQFTRYQFPIICSYCKIFFSKNQSFFYNLKKDDQYICSYCEQNVFLKFPVTLIGYIQFETVRMAPDFKYIGQSMVIVDSYDKMQQYEIFVYVFKKSKSINLKFMRTIKKKSKTNQSEDIYYMIKSRFQNGRLLMSGFQMKGVKTQQNAQLGKKLSKKILGFSQKSHTQSCNIQQYLTFGISLPHKMQPIKFNDTNYNTQLIRKQIPNIMNCYSEYGYDNFLCCSVEYAQNKNYYLPIFSLKYQDQQHQINNEEMIKNHTRNIQNSKTVLDYSNKQITQRIFKFVPQMIKLQANTIIQQLYLNNNKISNFEFVGQMRNLKIIQLQKNRIKKFAKLGTKLQQLNLSYNQIQEIPAFDEQFPNLRKLHIDHNKLKSLQNMKYFPYLFEFIAISNKIRQIQEMPQSLINLGLSFNQISQIKNINHLVNLHKLNLAANKITKIQNLDNLKCLELLILNRNNFILLDNIDGLQSLQILHVSRIGLTCSTIWSNSQKIQEAKKCGIMGLRQYKGLNNLKNLKKIVLDQNQIECPFTFLGISSQILQSFRNFDFLSYKNPNFNVPISPITPHNKSSNSHINIPGDTFKIYQPFTNLIQLNISKNKLKSMNDICAMMPFLEIINISHNQISCMKQMFKFKSLLEINLSHNLIKMIPKQGWSACYNLRVLNIGYNQIQLVPDLSGLIFVDEISFENNQINFIEGLPGQIGCICGKKTKINLSGNKLFDKTQATSHRENNKNILLKVTKKAQLLFQNNGSETQTIIHQIYMQNWAI